MIKLVVADFDGTLLPYGRKSVSEKTIGYIKRLISHGINFAVASGRTYSELKSLLEELSEDIYFICDDGALTVKNGKVLYKRQFSSSALNVFFDTDIFKNAVMYSLNKAYLIGFNSAPVLYGKTPCNVSRSFEITEDIYKITATTKCYDLVDSSFYRIHYSDGYFAEFVSPYANKGVAIGDLQLKLGVTKFDTAVIGDADNDIPMVAHSAFSWAVGNKSPKLASMCKKISYSAEEVLCEILCSSQKQHKTTYV